MIGVKDCMHCNISQSAMSLSLGNTQKLEMRSTYGSFSSTRTFAVVQRGSVFLGNYSPESAGDYASGTTTRCQPATCAKATVVSLDSFVKRASRCQYITDEGIKKHRDSRGDDGRGGGATRHKNAMTLRLASVTKASLTTASIEFLTGRRCYP